MRLLRLLPVLTFSLVRAVSITDIQGPAFLSPLRGQTVHDLSGIVTAKGPDGFWMVGEPVDDVRVSNGLDVFTTSKTVQNQVAVGDLISLSGIVAEFRSSSSSDANNLLATELDSPMNIQVLSSNNNVIPVILGVDRSPPTEQLSPLDVGPDGFLSVPNNQSRIDSVNATLQPDKYGIDFWSSLEGQLVTVRNPTVTNFANNFGEFWVYGDWPVTGKNSRGGLTMIFGPDGFPDATPEAVIVGSPLDGSDNPSVSVGVTLQDITGIIFYQFGFYYVLPLTAPVIVTTPPSAIPETTLSSEGSLCAITLGDYNVDNMSPTSSHLPTVAGHIVDFLHTPDIMFLQEIQDNDGEEDDGVVIANVTLNTLSTAVVSAGGNVQYNFTEVAPVNDQDGGAPGGNIRTAYLYQSDRLTLVTGSPAGGSLDATEPIMDAEGRVTLSFNPGRIDPTNSAWKASRKPLAAQWETPSGERLITINVHLTAKLGGSSTQGDARPPVNSGVDQRTSQVETVATFVKAVLSLDPNANVVVAGDHNEFVQTRSVFTAFSGILTEIDEASGVDPVERYTYVFDQNNEQLDHIFVSDAIVKRGTEVQHIHVNNWAPSIDARASDHDPSVAIVRVC